jgi:hypothetical protein
VEVHRRCEMKHEMEKDNRSVAALWNNRDKKDWLVRKMLLTNLMRI